jgi:hypothetical protein
MNPVVGTPFNQNPAPFPVPGPGGSGTALLGVVPLVRQANIPPLPPPPPPPLPPLPWPAPATGPVSQAGLPSAFRGWANYGGIRSTSDHFALSIVV